MARQHCRVVIDLGTGDGRAVLAEAASDPGTFVIGIDADARAMAEASRRAAGRATRGGVANARFVAAAVERLPADFDGIADRVTVRFPWGSLLRGALGLDADVAASIARLVAPSGRLEIVVSVEARDRPDGLDGRPFGEADLRRMSHAFRSFGLELVERDPLSPAALQATHSTWARRLRAGRERRAWGVTFERGPR